MKKKGKDEKKKRGRESLLRRLMQEIEHFIDYYRTVLSARQREVFRKALRKALKKAIERRLIKLNTPSRRALHPQVVKLLQLYFADKQKVKKRAPAQFRRH